MFIINVYCCLVIISCHPLFPLFIRAVPLPATNASAPADWQSYIDPVLLHKQLQRNATSTLSSELFEGDIAGIDTTFQAPINGIDNAILSADALWPNRTVPYKFIQNVSDPGYFDKADRKYIQAAMELITILTHGCIQFKPQTKETDYILFVKEISCYSFVGRQTGEQKVVLTKGCMDEYGGVQHEVMHALGFWHEHTRMDRDEFIRIICDNILKEDWPQFKKRKGQTFGLPYDYDSVLHYPFDAFSKERHLPTIVPYQKGAKIGQHYNLSPLDVVKIQKLYNCPIPDPQKLLQTGV